VSAAIDELGRVGQQVQETVASLEALRTGAIEKAVTSVTEKATALEDRLTNVQTRTLAAEATVSNLLTTVKDWQSRLPGLIDLVSALLTVFLLMMGLGQWALLSLGWSFLKVGAWIPFYPLNRGVRPA
jgi:chromosome segregation ATPase